MIIQKIEFNDKKDKFVIETDTKESFLLSYNDFEKFKIHNEMIIDDELYAHLLNISKFGEAFDISLFGYNMELDKATLIVETKINIWKEKYEGYELKNKIVTFLLQKGFSYDVAKQISGIY